MSIELPANVGSGLVEGLFTYSVATGPEPNRDPRAEPAQGTITFTPWPERLLNATATPPMTIITKPIECTLDAEGFLVDPEGDKGVRLIATNDKDLNPHDWTYRVAFSFDDGSRWSINLEVLEDETVDLTTVLPVSGSPGNAVIKGDPGRGVPPGGDDGEVLVKAGAADHNTSWQDPVLYVDDAVAQAGTYTDSQVSAIDTGAPTVHTHILTDLTDSTVLGRTLASVEDAGAGRDALGIEVDTSVGTRVMVGGIMVYGDTGSRRITEWDAEGNVTGEPLSASWVPVAGTLGRITVRRTTDTVTLTIEYLERLSTTSQMVWESFSLPPGFRPASVFATSYMASTTENATILVDDSGRLRRSSRHASGANGSIVYASLTMSAKAEWPSTLPGTPA